MCNRQRVNILTMKKIYKPIRKKQEIEEWAEVEISSWQKMYVKRDLASEGVREIQFKIRQIFLKFILLKYSWFTMLC